MCHEPKNAQDPEHSNDIQHKNDVHQGLRVAGSCANHVQSKDNDGRHNDEDVNDVECVDKESALVGRDREAGNAVNDDGDDDQGVDHAKPDCRARVLEEMLQPAACHGCVVVLYLCAGFP